MSTERRGRKRIGLAWAALLALLASTTFLAYLPLGRWSLAVSLAIAVMKAGLVLIIFMELATASGLTRLFAVAGFLWLGILLGLPSADYLMRSPSAPDEHQSAARRDPGEVRPR